MQREILCKWKTLGGENVLLFLVLFFSSRSIKIFLFFSLFNSWFPSNWCDLLDLSCTMESRVGTLEKWISECGKMLVDLKKRHDFCKGEFVGHKANQSST